MHWVKVVRYMLAGTAAAGVPLMVAFARRNAGSAVKGAGKIRVYDVLKGEYETVDRIEKTSGEWKAVLSPEEYHVTFEKGTERPFENKYNDNKEKGIYECVRCGNDLFTSEAKFDSGTGWPSFTAPVAEENVKTEVDRSIFGERTEVLCARCDAHLGHVFEDGPPPAYKRYCMNSVSLRFIKAE